MFTVILLVLVSLLIGIYFLNEKVLFPQKLEKINQFLTEKNYEEALNLIQSLPDNKRIDPSIQFKIYDLYLNQNQFFMALFHLNEILKREQFTAEINEVFVRQKIAEVYELMDKHKKALEEYQTIVGMDGENYIANAKIGEKLFYMKNYKAAQPFLEKAYELNQEDKEINKYLAELYFHQDRYSDAIGKCNEYEELGGDDLAVPLLRAKCYLLLNKYEESLSDSEKIAEDPILKNEGKLVQALCLFNLGRHKEAADLFSYCLVKFHEKYNTIILMGRYAFSKILLERGELKDSIRQLYLIQNSGRTYKDSSIRLKLYTRMLNSKVFNNFFNENLEKFISIDMAKGLAVNGHAIQKVETIGKHSGIFMSRKNISSGQSFKTVIGFDLGDVPTPASRAGKFITFIKGQGLTSGLWFSLAGLEPSAGEVFNQPGYEVSLPSFVEFEKIMSGERSI